MEFLLFLVVVAAFCGIFYFTGIGKDIKSKLRSVKDKAEDKIEELKDK